MNNLNTDITSINIQDSGINLLYSSKTVVNSAKKYLQSNKSKWTKQLLLELTKTPLTFRPVSDLGNSSGLDNTVYPVLAKLHRQSLVETKQFKDTRGIMLTYRLTEKAFLAL